MTIRPDQPMEMHSMLGAYALDALDDLERQSFERHLAGCRDCSAEFAEFAETASRLAIPHAVAPPAALRERVLAEVARTRQLPPLAQASTSGGRRPGLPGQRWLAAAASVLLVAAVAAGALAAQWREDAQAARDAQLLAVQLLTDPDRQVLTAEFSGGTGTIVVADDEAVVVGEDVPAPPQGHGYQLWVFDADGPHSRGMLTQVADGRYVGLIQDLSGGQAIGITVEPEDGSPDPTTEPVLVEDLPELTA